MVSIAERLVVDASVAVKWHVPDEPDADRAIALLDRFLGRQIALVAPSHIRAEVPSAITVATRAVLGGRRQPRLTPEEGAAAISEFLALGLPTFDDDQLVAAAYATAHLHGCAFYDALYLALAERLGVRLILADERFHALIGHLPYVVRLSDYQPAT